MMSKRDKRLHRKTRIRAKITGTASRPRFVVFRSNTALYVQIVNDETGKTLLASSIKGKTIAKAKELGTAVAAVAKKKGIETIVFDRGGYRYHGVVKALADAVREGGLHV